MEKKWFLAIGVIIVLFFSGYELISTSAYVGGGEITVLCGSGIIKPMDEIIKNFESETGAKVNVQYGGSGELLGTLMTTKKGDVLVVGEYTTLDKAMEKGYVINETAENISAHRPLIAVKKGNPKDIKSLSDLIRSDVKLAVGDPNACAIGKVTADVFKKESLTLGSNVVAKTPTVAQLLSYILSGQVDAVIIWDDMVTWNNTRDKIDTIDIGGVKYEKIPAAVTTTSKNNGLAEKFVQYLKNEKSKEIWQKWGFKSL